MSTNDADNSSFSAKVPQPKGSYASEGASNLTISVAYDETENLSERVSRIAAAKARLLPVIEELQQRFPELEVFTNPAVRYITLGGSKDVIKECENVLKIHPAVEAISRDAYLELQSGEAELSRNDASSPSFSGKAPQPKGSYARQQSETMAIIIKHEPITAAFESPEYMATIDEAKAHLLAELQARFPEFRVDSIDALPVITINGQKDAISACRQELSNHPSVNVISENDQLVTVERIRSRG